MEKKFTPYARTIAYTLFGLLALMLNLIGQKSFGQVSCANSTVLFSQTYGEGTTVTSDPDVLTTGLTYQATGSLAGEGKYRVINNTQQKPEWQKSGDHTGDLNGMMEVINGQAETYWEHEIDKISGYAAGTYTASVWLMNIDTLGLCGPNALLPNITFKVEYLNQNNVWTALTGSPYTAAPVPQTSPANPKWIELGSSFILPKSPGFTVTAIHIILSDGTVGGCGNDFAMDDIKFSQCPQGGPLPVTFLGMTARQQGSGVSVDWSTSQEINSSRFEVLKSADGNTNWNLVGTITAAGNSQVVKSYNLYDASPISGNSYYRVREVDLDGNYTYSEEVAINLNFASTAATVLTNPFQNALTVDFASNKNQIVSARLFDITGKQVATEKWTISSGSSRQYFSKISNLQQGIYILNVSNDRGEVLLNSKVVKQ